MKINLDEWKNARLESKFGNRDGRVAYGIRRAMAPSNEPLVEDRTLIENHYPRRSNHWFVSPDANQDVKVRLYLLVKIGDTIYAIGRDTNFFCVKIRKK